MISCTFLDTWLPLLIPILDPLARDSCLSSLILREKIVVSQLSLSAYRTQYCDGERARKAVWVGGCLIVPCFDFNILRSAFNFVQ